MFRLTLLEHVGAEPLFEEQAARPRIEPERARESLCAAGEGRSRTMVSGWYSSRVPLLIAAMTQLAVRVPFCYCRGPSSSAVCELSSNKDVGTRQV